MRQERNNGNNNDFPNIDERPEFSFRVRLKVNSEHKMKKKERGRWKGDKNEIHKENVIKERLREEDDKMQPKKRKKRTAKDFNNQTAEYWNKEVKK